MSALTTLDFLYPWFGLDTDPRYVGDEERRQQFLTFAESYRPRCLGLLKGDEAVAHYAAHLMDTYIAETSGGAVSQERVVKKESEGDVSREYEAGVIAGSGVAAPLSPYQRWEILARICRSGAILVSTATPTHPCLPSGFR